jgi:hypothetical protein
MRRNIIPHLSCFTPATPKGRCHSRLPASGGSGAGQFFLTSSFRRRSWPAQPRNLYSPFSFNPKSGPHLPLRVVGRGFSRDIDVPPPILTFCALLPHLCALLPQRPKGVVIPSGAGQFFLTSSFRRRSWPAQPRNLSSPFSWTPGGLLFAGQRSHLRKLSRFMNWEMERSMRDAEHRLQLPPANYRAINLYSP